MQRVGANKEPAKKRLATMRCWVALALAAAVKAAADSRDVELLGDGSIAVPTLGDLQVLEDPLEFSSI